MQQERKNKQNIIRYNVVSSIITSILTICLFILLGSFYIALDHNVITNLMVWSLTIIIAYFLFYFGYYIFMRLKKINPKLIFNTWPFLSGYFVITLLCLSQSFEFDDFHFVSITISITGFLTIIEIFNFIRRKNKD